MKCEFCNDTGSLSKDLGSFLDCPHCDAAEERIALECWYKETRKKHDTIDLLWLAFQHGRNKKEVDAGQ